MKIKRKKQVLSVLLVCSMIIQGISGGTHSRAADSEVTVGDCVYTLKSDGTAELKKYSGTAASVNVLESVTDSGTSYAVETIGSGAFSGCTPQVIAGNRYGKGRGRYSHHDQRV